MPQRTGKNVLVFFCDQLLVSLLGCYGGTQVRTPNIDALAEDSVVFENAYTPTALCSPARASLMTGVYPHRHHMFNNSSPSYSYCLHMRPEMTMLSDWIADETSYESAYFGKWHIGPVADLFNSRFEHVAKPYPGGPEFMKSGHWHPGENFLPTCKSMAGGKAGTVDAPMEEFPDVVAAQYTKDFLRKREGDRPFMAFCAFPGPHSPWRVPDSFGIRYKPEDIPLWPNRHDRFEGKPLFQRKLRLMEDTATNSNCCTNSDDELRELLACNFSYLELVDQQVGEVINTLKELGQYEETTIIFTADHGDMAGAHGFISKGAYMYDEVYRIPLLMKAAGETTPRRVEAPVHLMDVTATCLHAMAGSEQTEMGQQELHGQSLLGFADSDPCWPRSVHYAQYHGDWNGHYSSRMVTDGRRKLVWNLSDLGEFYNLEDDPHELKNRFYDPDVRAERDEYFSILVQEAKRLRDGHVNKFVPEIEDVLWDCRNGPLATTEQS
jgi:arylsulfatase A-like enzyme